MEQTPNQMFKESMAQLKRLAGEFTLDDASRVIRQLNDACEQLRKENIRLRSELRVALDCVK